jgi:NitT/TauT family transport system substrate-binding protein
MGSPSRAAAETAPQKVTIALAGKGMSFILQYVALGAGLYKAEGLDPDTVDVSSGTRQAAAVMGGSADFTQLGMPHTLRAVARGGDLVAIGTGFDMYPIALVISKSAAQRLGITEAMSVDERLRRIHGLKIGITSPGSSTDEFMRTIMMVRGLDPDKDVRLQPIGIGAPMVAAMQQGSKAAPTASPSCRPSPTSPSAGASALSLPIRCRRTSPSMTTCPIRSSPPVGRPSPPSGRSCWLRCGR